MAHDPTRSWPTGKGPGDTSIPGAAWLELLNGQSFPVVGAGAMMWNGAMWMPVSAQNRLPVEATLPGIKLETVYFFNGQEIRDTNFHDSGLLWLNRFRRVNYYVQSTLNVPVAVWPQPLGSDMYGYRDGQWKLVSEIARTAPILVTGFTRIYPLNSLFPELDYAYERMRWRVKCDQAPTSGSLTLFAVGVLY